MYYIVQGLYTPASQRKLSIIGNDLAGGLDVINNSTSIHFSTGCGAATISPTKGICAPKAGIDAEINNGLFEIFPNPATNQVTIRTKEESRLVTLKIIDMTGRVIIEKRVSNMQGTSETRSLKSGIYFVELLTENSITSQKLIISHE